MLHHWFFFSFNIPSSPPADPFCSAFNDSVEPWHLLSTSMAQCAPLEADSEVHVNKIRAKKKKEWRSGTSFNFITWQHPRVKDVGQGSSVRYSPCIRVELWPPSAALAAPSQPYEGRRARARGKLSAAETSFWDFTRQFSPSSSPPASFQEAESFPSQPSSCRQWGRQGHSANGCAVNNAEMCTRTLGAVLEMEKKHILLFNWKSGQLYRNHFGFLSAIPYPFPSSPSIRQWPFIKSYMLSYVSLGIAFFFEKHEFTLNSMRFFFCIGRQNTILKFLVSFWVYSLHLFTYQRSFVRDWG